jgi:hypothetical protein
MKLELTKDETLMLKGLLNSNLEHARIMQELPDNNKPGLIQHMISCLESLVEKVDNLVEQLEYEDMALALAPEEEETTTFFVQNPETGEKIHIVLRNADLLNQTQAEIQARIEKVMEHSGILKSYQQQGKSKA